MMKSKSPLLTIKYFHLVLFLLCFLAPNHQVKASTTTKTTGSSITGSSVTGFSTTWNPTTRPSKTSSVSPTPTPISPPIVQVAKVSYRESIIRIFADAGVRNHSRFFFEPLVHLDPKSIFAYHHSILQWDVVSFTIEMWNQELRRKVLARLQSLNSQHFNMTNIGEEDIYVLPFEEVVLINDPAIEVTNQLKSYARQSENLEFYINCNCSATANDLAEDFRRNPGFLLDHWHMALEGSGLILDDQVERKPIFYKYPVVTSNSTSSPHEQGEPLEISIRAFWPWYKPRQQSVTDMPGKYEDSIVLGSTKQRVKRQTHYHYHKPQYGYNYQPVGSLHYHDAMTGQVVAGNSYIWPYIYYNSYPYYSPYYYYGR